jgi:hypothetical protein
MPQIEGELAQLNVLNCGDGTVIYLCYYLFILQFSASSAQSAQHVSKYQACSDTHQIM